MLRIGTRGSKLAKWQANWVATQITELGYDVELVLITTQGDAQQSGPIGSIGGQGLFTKEIQQALLDERIDVAVHSLKDLPTEPVAELSLAAVPPREAVGDVLVSGKTASLEDIPQSARIGTGSLRRRAQLLHTRGDLQVEDIRGNVDTRLAKLDAGEFDAIILAEAGLRRLGFENRIAQVLPASLMLPAVGQGALGIETRTGDATTRDALAPLNHPATRQAVLAERTLLHHLRGGCLAPIGAWARIDGGRLRLSAVVLSPDGRQRLYVDDNDTPDAAEQLGRRTAEALVSDGAQELIAGSRGG